MPYFHTNKWLFIQTYTILVHFTNCAGSAFVLRRITGEQVLCKCCKILEMSDQFPVSDNISKSVFSVNAYWSVGHSCGDLQITFVSIEHLKLNFVSFSDELFRNSWMDYAAFWNECYSQSLCCKGIQVSNKILVSEMTYYVSSGTLNPTHSLQQNLCTFPVT